MKLLVFTPCYNERHNIGPLLDQIVAELPDADLLVIDDNSPDGTWDVILDKARTYRQLTAVRRPRKLGIGTAHKYALFYAMREGYDTLITMDADFSHQPSELRNLLAAHGPNVFVTGSRYCAGGKSDYTGYRDIVSRLGNFAARRALGVRLGELTTYFRVFDVQTLRRLPLRHVNAVGYSYGVQLVYYLRKAGVALREVPIHFVDRSHGSSKIPRMQIVISAVDLFVLAFKRLNRVRDILPDAFVDDACPNCGDRVLAMKHRGRTWGMRRRRVVYTCLRCGLEQTPGRLAPATGGGPRGRRPGPSRMVVRLRCRRGGKRLAFPGARALCGKLRAAICGPPAGQATRAPRIEPSAPQPGATLLPYSVWPARRWIAVEAGVGALLALYLVYNLIVSKFFSPAIGPGAFRDLGILWDMADYVRANGRYEIGANYYPPPNAILLRLFGSIGQELAYRLFLLLRIAAFVAVLWAWCRLLGISRRQDRMLIVLAAVLPVAFYLHVEFHMHNVNLITLALVSVAMAIECRPLWSGAGYGLALALKPYGSVLILPWMVWRGRWCWVLSALGWLAVFFLVMPMVWFGPDAALPLNREWMVSLVTGAQTAHDQLLSLRGGIAFLLGASTADPLVGRLNWAATALYVLALVAFFLPTLLRREPASRVMLASEIAAMLLAPLPLGGLQQPARASALIAATLVMAAACFEAGRSRRARAALAAVLVAIGLACNAVPLGPLHFLLMMPVCLMALAGLAIARGTHARGAPAYDTVR